MELELAEHVVDGRQFLVVSTGFWRQPQKLIALALPDRSACK